MSTLLHLPTEVLELTLALVESEDIYALWRSGSIRMRHKLQICVRSFKINTATKIRLLPWPMVIYHFSRLQNLYIDNAWELYLHLPTPVRLLETLAHLPLESLTFHECEYLITPYLDRGERMGEEVDDEEDDYMCTDEDECGSSEESLFGSYWSKLSLPSQVPSLKTLFPRLRQIQLRVKPEYPLLKRSWWFELPSTLEKLSWGQTLREEEPLPSLQDLFPNLIELDVGDCPYDYGKNYDPKRDHDEIEGLPQTLTSLRCASCPIDIRRLLKHIPDTWQTTSQPKCSLPYLKSDLDLTFTSADPSALKGLKHFPALESLQLNDLERLKECVTTSALHEILIDCLPRSLTSLDLGVVSIETVPNLPHSITKLSLKVKSIASQIHRIIDTEQAEKAFYHLFTSLPRELSTLELEFSSSLYQVDHPQWSERALKALPKSITSCHSIFRGEWPKNIDVAEILPSLKFIDLHSRHLTPDQVSRLPTTITAIINHLNHMVYPPMFEGAEYCPLRLSSLKTLEDLNPHVFRDKEPSSIDAKNSVSVCRLHLHLPRSLTNLSLYVPGDRKDCSLHFSSLQTDGTEHFHRLTTLNIFNESRTDLWIASPLPSNLERLTIMTFCANKPQHLDILIHSLPPHLKRLEINHLADVTDKHLGSMPRYLCSLRLYLRDKNKLATYDPKSLRLLPRTIMLLRLPGSEILRKLEGASFEDEEEIENLLPKGIDVDIGDRDEQLLCVGPSSLSYGIHVAKSLSQNINVILNGECATKAL